MKLTYDWVIPEGAKVAHLTAMQFITMTACGRKINPTKHVVKAVDTDPKCGSCLRTHTAKRTAT